MFHFACCLLLAGYLLELLLNPEDGGGISSWNISELLLPCVAFHPRGQYFSSKDFFFPESHYFQEEYIVGMRATDWDANESAYHELQAFNLSEFQIGFLFCRNKDPWRCWATFWDKFIISPAATCALCTMLDWSSTNWWVELTSQCDICVYNILKWHSPLN